MNVKSCFQLSVLTTALALAGCGGSSSSTTKVEEPPVVSPVPTVSIDDVTVDEKAVATVAASVDGNGDDDLTYSWEVSSDFDIEVTGEDTGTLSFTAPEVSADSTVDLSLTVTDSDGDAVTATSTVNISQLTIPLSISGLATDSPIANAQIVVRIAGRDVTVDAVADSTGAYTVNLMLDDSEEAAFISIEARGVGEQSSAGLISLLGTAGQLSDQAGDDGELTSDESFAVNVTNVTTAQYALAKLANDGQDITSDEQLAEISETLNYDEVMTLATAIKVAIDKAAENAELALPAEIPDTLALVEAIVDTLVEANEETQAAQDYIQDVQDEPEFEEAQEEIYEDETLVDTSGYEVPSSYYLLPPSTLHSGTIFYFNEDGTGSGIDTEFTWQEADGFVSIVNTAYETTDSVEYINLEGDEFDYEVEVAVETHTSGYQMRRISSNDNGEVVTLTTTSVKHYVEVDLPDEVTSDTFTHFALRDSAVKPIEIAPESVAYLSTGWQEQINGIEVSADEFEFYETGLGYTRLHGQNFTWQVTDGILEVTYEGEETTSTFKLLSEQAGTDFFASETIEGDEVDARMVGEGKIASEYPQWTAENVPGIYDYEDLAFDDPNDQFWFELSENGDAVTYSTGDWNENGYLETDEVTAMYGGWSINDDGTLTITRHRFAEGGYSADCSSTETENCLLWHERNWTLIGNTDDQYGLFHKHHFMYINMGWGEEDYITFDIRTLFKKDAAPIDVSTLPEPAEKPARAAKGVTVETSKDNVSNKYKKLEPSFN